MRMLDAAQVDPSGIVAFMRSLESAHRKRPRLASYLSSHPSTADRVAALEAMARNARTPYRPLLDSAAWRQVKAMCASDGSSSDSPARTHGS
jgi:predicted Zn-dependent protease